MSLAASMLPDDALRARDDGFELDVHLNWYRSLPLSSLKTVQVTVNGEAIDRDEITWVVTGAEHRLDDLGEKWAEIWFALEPAPIRVPRPLVKPGDSADVTVRLGNRIPYILIGPDQALEYVSEKSKTLVVR